MGKNNEDKTEFYKKLYSNNYKNNYLSNTNYSLDKSLTGQNFSTILDTNKYQKQ